MWCQINLDKLVFFKYQKIFDTSKLFLSYFYILEIYFIVSFSQQLTYLGPDSVVQ